MKRKIPPRRRNLTALANAKPVKTAKLHPWRLCPSGQHWVRTHPMRVPPSTKNLTGYITTRHEHCADNPSKKDQLYFDEITEIAEREFAKVKKRPCPSNLDFGKKGSAYDHLFTGWVIYWNNVLKPDVPLDLNLFKALVASESRFLTTILADKNDPNSARGLTQITNKTRKILADEKGELKNHYITATREQLNDPNINICAGVRWLFHKKYLASYKLKRPATWHEAVAEYKAIREKLNEGDKRAAILMGRFLKYLRDYEKCGK